MSDVKRYDCTNGGAQWCQGCYQMTEDAEGDYVTFADFAAEVAAREKAQEEADRRTREVELTFKVQADLRTRAEAAEARELEMLEALNASERKLGRAESALSALAARLAAMEAALAEAPVVEVMEVGNDDTGQPRVLCHGTIEELRKGAALVYRRVRLVRDAAIAHAPGAEGGGNG